jgi:hypothetical protein
MTAALNPESWALLALCGMVLSLVTAMLAVEPGLILMPLLAILLPRVGIQAENVVPVAAATAVALLIPLSIARLGSLQRQERERVLRLAPAVIAGGFFGASLLPSMPGPFVLTGFSILAAIALLYQRRSLTIALAVAPPARRVGPLTSMGKSVLSALFGIGLPLTEGRKPESAALTLILGASATAALIQAPAACKGCAGLVFMPALVAVAAGAVLKMPLLTMLFREARPRLRPAVLLFALVALLTTPIRPHNTAKTALAAFVPGLCAARARDGPGVFIYRDPFPGLVRRFGPRRGLASLKTGTPSQSAFIKTPRDVPAAGPSFIPPAWTASIETNPPKKPAKQPGKQTSSLSKL